MSEPCVMRLVGRDEEKMKVEKHPTTMSKYLNLPPLHSTSTTDPKCTGYLRPASFFLPYSICLHSLQDKLAQVVLRPRCVPLPILNLPVLHD